MTALAKYFRAARTGGKHGSDPLTYEIAVHLVKNTVKIFSPSQIMGWFRTTIQNKPDGWNDFLKLPVEFRGHGRPGTRQGAAGEKNRIASFRKPIPGKE
jgi:hypothetical protein